MSCFRLLFLLIGLLITNKYSWAQDHNYHQLFSTEFSQATKYLSANKWIKDSLESRGIDPLIALSIVFPELLRYHKLQNQIEVTALKTLYVQYGASFADFSIGHFQMKPSFAEEIENQWNQLKEKPSTCAYIHFNTEKSENIRALRVKRLDQDQGQILYLSLFYFLVEQKFATLCSSSIPNKIQFFSTAYNCGFYKKAHTIIQKSHQQEFTLDLYPSCFSKFYSYSDIALYFYKYALNTNFLASNVKKKQ